MYSGFIGRTPFIRSLTLLWDSLGLGMKALMFSADVAMQGQQAEMSKPVRWSSMAVAMAFAIGLFFVLPVLAGTAAQELSGSALLAHVVEALFRLGLLVGYVGLIGLFPEIRRVYAYHGAEHMTIHAYEAGEPLVPKRIKRFSPAHPRCGTAFLMLVVIISVFVFVLVGTAGPDYAHSLQNHPDPGDRRSGLRGLAVRRRPLRSPAGPALQSRRAWRSRR